jgi:hypothetical protein
VAPACDLAVAGGLPQTQPTVMGSIVAVALGMTTSVAAATAEGPS